MFVFVIWLVFCLSEDGVFWIDWEVEGGKMLVLNKGFDYRFVLFRVVYIVVVIIDEVFVYLFFL